MARLRDLDVLSGLALLIRSCQLEKLTAALAEKHTAVLAEKLTATLAELFARLAAVVSISIALTMEDEIAVCKAAEDGMLPRLLLYRSWGAYPKHHPSKKRSEE